MPQAALAAAQQTSIYLFRKLSAQTGLCISLVRWGGREAEREGTYVYLWLIHAEA